VTGAASLDSMAIVVQIWFPVLRDGSLNMGEVGMLVTDRSCLSAVRKLQASVYEALRMVLKKSFRSGIWGRNSKTGGEHFYADILISEAAARAYGEGTILAPQLGDGFVTYHLSKFAS